MPGYHSCSSVGSSSTHGSSVGRSHSSGTSITHGESETWSTGVTDTEGVSYRPGYYTDTPYRSYAGDPETVARCIFQDDLRDALSRLKRRSALRGAEARVWCIAELLHLLLELLTDDVA